MPTQPEILISAGLIIRQDGKTLLVRKRNTTAFIQPGGKIQPDENPTDALCRELQEELQITTHPDQMRYMGRYSAPAVNEQGYTVTAEVFLLTITSPVTPHAEIEEIIWADPNHLDDLTLAPLTRDYILPLLNTL